MEHPITPPPELVAQWLKQFYGPATRLGTLAPGEASLHVAAEAARWGADQELEACCEWVAVTISVPEAAELRAARRPKPPTDDELLALKEKLWGKYKTIPYEGEEFMYGDAFKSALSDYRAALERWGHR